MNTFLVAAAAFAVAATLASCRDGKTVTPASRPTVALSPTQAVRGATLVVKVDGLDSRAGAAVDLTLADASGANELGIGEGTVGHDGRLESTVSVPNRLGAESALVPGEYRMIFDVKTSPPERFSHTVEVVPAVVGQRYGHVPQYECLEYTFFDGRMWRRDRGDLESPVEGATIELIAGDAAAYTAPDGRTAVFRVANPAAERFDAETYTCPG